MTFHVLAYVLVLRLVLMERAGLRLNHNVPLPGSRCQQSLGNFPELSNIHRVQRVGAVSFPLQNVPGGTDPEKFGLRRHWKRESNILKRESNISRVNK
jgi:hypothetical protein